MSKSITSKRTRQSADVQPAVAPEQIPLDSIRIDGGTQIRVETNEATVHEYREQMQLGAVFPPVTLFYDGTDYWLADGFQRYRAAKLAKKDSILAVVQKGTVRDAILYAVGANTTHGVRRTYADKRHAVETLLKDKQWCKRSDRWIGEKCNVSHPYIASIRELVTVTSCESKQAPRVGRDGKTRKVPQKKKTTRAIEEPVVAASECAKGGDHQWIRDDDGSEHCEKCFEPAECDHQWVDDGNRDKHCSKCGYGVTDISPTKEECIHTWMNNLVVEEHYDKAEAFCDYLEDLAAEARKYMKRPRKAKAEVSA